MDAPQLTRRELFDRARLKPMTTNASELGTSAPALAKLASHLELPLPSSGLWMKKEAGKAPPLLEYLGDPSRLTDLYPVPHFPQRSMALTAGKNIPPASGPSGSTARSDGEVT